MAKPRKRVVMQTVPEPDEAPACCGLCVNAYGFCWPGYDGKPLSCRCHFDPEFLKKVASPACGRFERSGTPVPDSVSEKVSENLHEDMIPRKVVPFFRPGEAMPWKYVWSDAIPVGGISSFDPELAALPGPEVP